MEALQKQQTDQRMGLPHRRSGLPRLLGQLWGSTTFGDILAAARYVIDRKALVQGPAIEVYERAFARQVGTSHGITFSSGRLAFYSILQALGIGDGDEVLMQVPTHIVVANAVRYVGATPVYIDCDLDTYNMDLVQAEARVTERTRVLLIQHTFGIPADMDTAVDLARRHNLILIEDCVHALGATYRGRPVGSFGRAAFFSTEETKIISSTMGGMAVTNDSDLAASLRDYQQACDWPKPELAARYLVKLIVYHLFAHPWIHPYTRNIYMRLRKNPSNHLAPGATSPVEMTGKLPRGGELPDYYNLRMSNGQAVVALRQLRRLEKNLAHRRSKAELYRRWLSEFGFHVPTPPPHSNPSWVRFPVWVEDRPDAMQKARPHVILGQWFNTVLEESTSPEAGDYRWGTCPRAEAAAIHLVNVPTHQRVTRGDVEAIVAALCDTPHGKPDLNSEPLEETQSMTREGFMS